MCEEEPDVLLHDVKRSSACFQMETWEKSPKFKKTDVVSRVFFKTPQASVQKCGSQTLRDDKAR